MRILLFGLGKSGTTALYTKVLRSLPGYVGEYENDKDWSPNLVRKQLGDLLFPEPPTRHEEFDKRVWLVRDPRGNLLSYVLYMLSYCSDAGYEELFGMLRQKQDDPRSISFSAFYDKYLQYIGSRDIYGHDNIPDPMTRYPDSVRLYRRCGGDFFVYRYEDMVVGNFDPLERYLGVPLTGDTEVDAAYRRVARTKSAGSWRNWFTRDDVRRFRPHMSEYITYFGYDPRWSLAKEPEIHADESYEYFARVRAEVTSRG